MRWCAMEYERGEWQQASNATGAKEATRCRYASQRVAGWLANAYQK